MRFKARCIVLLSLALLLGSVAEEARAQTLLQELQGTWRAEVVRVIDEKEENLPGASLPVLVQTLEVTILEGEREGEHVTFQNDYIRLEEGDRFFLNYLVTAEGDAFYSVRDFDRTNSIIVLIIIFAGVIILFGGFQGVRSLASLVGSLIVILYVLAPTLVKGFPPIPTSIAVAVTILFFAIFFTHGFNRRSLIAFSGTIIAVILTGVLAHISISVMHLSGIASDEATYLNLNTRGTLDFVGLLLGAIIIGSLGVLDDIAVTQVAVVEELLGAGITKRRALYTKALRVGREHVGALVNTLVLAYAGASLPLVLLFSQSEVPLLHIANREIFTAEIVRTLVGSIGLILTVPITTALAAFFARPGEARSHPHHH